jgi:hypothetical protein
MVETSELGDLLPKAWQRRDGTIRRCDAMPKREGNKHWSIYKPFAVQIYILAPTGI